ncbi:hypothetical protein GCM10011608_33130 [Micromonospora sonchi]|uniref:Sortase n=1 Tax=Micromonospora sonchi TaxID=1763543 RepID=A0A917TZ89_9ACTN|nr:hypothetical protein GCM10011608_33130 [Micromonospora sonchi]
MTRTRPALRAASFAAPLLALATAAALAAAALPGLLLATPARAAAPGETAARQQPATSLAARQSVSVAQPFARPVAVPLAEREPVPGPNVFIEVSPSMVEPGHLVGLKASCHDNSVGAIVVSDAFGRVAVHPQRGLLTGTAQVKDRVLPGSYRVKLECRGGETASTVVQVVRIVKPTIKPTIKPSRGPATGFGGGSGGFTSGLLLPGGLALTVSGIVVWAMARRRGARW